MRRCPRGAFLLVLLVAVPVPALCAVCSSETCLARSAAAPSPATGAEDGGCHAMSHAVPAADATLEAVTPDCCASAAAAREKGPAVQRSAPDAPSSAPTGLAPRPLVPRPRSAVASVAETPPPDLIRPLYTLNGSLLI